jgi:hypothetical protein
MPATWKEGRVKRLLMTGLFVVAALGLSTTVALADNGSGNGTDVTKYTATYTDPAVGPVTCTGVHQDGKNFPDSTSHLSGGQDSFTCTSTTGLPLTNVTPGEVVTLATFGGWISDYFDQQAHGGHVIFANSLMLTVSSDGLSYGGEADYPITV